MCSKCINNNTCKKCYNSFYLYKNSCFNSCPDVTYQSANIGAPGSQPCLTCYGKGNTKCIICNKDQGYILYLFKRI